MHQATIKLPEKMDLPTLLGFARDLDYFVMHDKITLDFGERGFFSPYSMLFLSAKLKYFREKNPNLRFEFKHYKDHPYAAHMGFFKMFGIDHGRNVGEAWGSENYVPITLLKKSDLEVEPSDRFEETQDLVQRHADKIARIISRNESKNWHMFDALSYSIREMIRNVFEHSGCDSLYYCAQYWEKSNKVEFAIADLGIGIRRSLGENPNFRFSTDKEAIECCLMPSVSGKTHLPRRSENWFNSGYGLYMTSRLARHGGNFVLASGEKAVHLTPATKGNYNTSFRGTALRFNLDVSRIGDVQGRLAQFHEEGQKAAKFINGTGNRPASAMSLLLRRDYSGLK